MSEVRNYGLFQWINQKYIQIVREPFNVDAEYFDRLKSKHYKLEFTSKYNENLFVDQDKDSGKSLINEILLNQDHIGYLSNELRILKDWIDDFKKEYHNLKSLLEIENIDINKRSKQYNQLELLLKKSQSILYIIRANKEVIDSEKLKLPLQIKKIDNNNLEISEGFNFQRLNEYSPEHRFILQEPSDKFAVVIVFRRLSQIVTQIESINRLVNRKKSNQTKFIHGNAGMGKSNFSAFVYNELGKIDKPAIIISGKSFNGDPDSFEDILMNNLLIPDNYKLEEVLKRLNNYVKKTGNRLTLIFDGLNETSYAHDGFSKLWEKSLNSFVETLKSYPYLFLVATLRTSYISRIWANNSIPYSQIQLKGFKGDKLRKLIYKYFKEYKIDDEALIESDVFYFKTPLYLDLYCQMLNGDKKTVVKPLLGLDGFKQVFDDYLNKLVDKVSQKLNLITKDQVWDGIDGVSGEMIMELEAYVPILTFYEKMEGKVVTSIDKTIGYEILQEYLIYLDENHNNKDVIIHTQQEVGGYLLAKKLIADNGSVDGVILSQFFQDTIIGNSGHFHQLKDDILKFLISQSKVDSLLFTKYINLEVVKKFTLLNLQRNKSSEENLKLVSMLSETNYSLNEVKTLINDISISLFEYDLDANINFIFLKNILVKQSNYDLDLSWTLHVYNNHHDFSEFLMHFINFPDDLEGNENDSIIIELTIWLSETTIRDLRDKSTRFLLQYFSVHPSLLLEYILEYSNTNHVYIQERLALVCYGVSLRLQNDEQFIQNQLGSIATSLYGLQFANTPSNPTYNYIVIDSYKHLIDLAIIKGVFELDGANLNRLANYEFNKNDWFNINEADRNAVPIAHNWSLSTNPDPLAGDFVHYTIPRLDNLSHETRLDNTANIYKEIIRLGYISNTENLSDREQSFFRGTSLLGSRIKVDRLGKKYSWIAYFNFAGYLLSQNRLGILSDEDSSYEKHYERLSDTEIEPSYDENKPIVERFINTDFFEKRTLDSSEWINEPNYGIVNGLYVKDDFTLLSAFIDQKLDDKYETRSWVEVKSFFVNKDQVGGHIKELENRDFEWKHSFRSNGSISKIYFGELYWADSVPTIKKERHQLPLQTTIENERVIDAKEIILSGSFDYEDAGKVVKETIQKPCYFEYEPSLMDFLWETDSKQIPSLRCDIPSPNIGKHLRLTVDSSKTKILNSNLEICFKEYFTEYGVNSEKFHYFKTDLLKKYLEETNQVLMYQIKQFTYDNAVKIPTEHFRGLQFKFSSLNR